MTMGKTKWTLDSKHSEIAFKVRHMMIAHVKGTFKTFDAAIYANGTDFSSAEINLWIDVNSVSTGEGTRDDHLKGPDFFDVEKFDQILFVSSGLNVTDDSTTHELKGTLTIKGVAREITLQVEAGGIVNDPWGKERAGFTVSGVIKRSEWGLSWNSLLDAGGLMLGDEVSISCEVELINAGEHDLTMIPDPRSEEKSIF